MPEKVPLRFYKYQTNGQTYYDVLPQGSVKDKTEVTDLNEINQAISQYSAKTDDWSQKYVSTLQKGLQDVQSGASPYVLNDKGILATQSEVAAQQAQQQALASGKAMMVGGTPEAPLTAPVGTPDPKTVTYEQSLAGPAGGIPGVQPSKPVQGSGNYVEDLAKSFDQPASGLGSAAETNRLLGGQYFNPDGSQAKPFTASPQTTQDAGRAPASPTPAPAPQVAGSSDSLRANQLKQQIEQYKDILEPGGAPTPFSSVAEYDRLRTEKGIVNDEMELSAIQNETAQLRQAFRVFESQQGKGVTEGGRIGAITEEERNLSFRLESLAIRENAVVNRLNTKNQYINNVLKLTGDDYDRTKQEYDEAYSKNLQALQLANGDLDQQKQDALTTLSTVSKLISEKGLTQITPQLRTQLESAALSAGLPLETVDLMLTQSQAGDKLEQIYSRDEGIFAVMTGADGVPYVQQLSSAPVGTGSGSGGGGNTTGGTTGGSSTTLQRILDGVGSVSDLTPTEKKKLQDEAYANGLYEDNPPKWFIDSVQNEMSMSMTSEALKKLWDEYKKPLSSNTTVSKDLNSSSSGSKTTEARVP